MISDFRASLVAFGRRLVDQAREEGLSPDLQYCDLDAFAEVQELPSVDLIGLTGLACDVRGKVHTVDGQFGVLTMNDPGNFKHYALVDRLYRTLQPEKTVPLVRDRTGELLGWMAAQDGTAVDPMARAGDVRGFQAVRFTLLADPYATSAAR